MLEDPQARSLLHRKLAGGASLALVVALLWPVGQNWADVPEDGFPLSYYPMFTKPREPTTVIHHVVAVDASGTQVNLPGYYAGPGGMNTTRRQMRKMVFEGRAQELAERVARRLQRNGRAARMGVVRVEVVESTYDIKRFFAGARHPVARITHARANIETGASS